MKIKPKPKRKSRPLFYPRPRLRAGISFTRYVRALARSGGNLTAALEIVRNNKTWMDQSPEVETVLKAAVAAGATIGATWAASPVNGETMKHKKTKRKSRPLFYPRPRTIRKTISVDDAAKRVNPNYEGIRSP